MNLQKNYTGDIAHYNWTNDQRSQVGKIKEKLQNDQFLN